MVDLYFVVPHRATKAMTMTTNDLDQRRCREKPSLSPKHIEHIIIVTHCAYLPFLLKLMLYNSNAWKPHSGESAPHCAINLKSYFSFVPPLSSCWELFITLEFPKFDKWRVQNQFFMIISLQWSDGGRKTNELFTFIFFLKCQ